MGHGRPLALRCCLRGSGSHRDPSTPLRVLGEQRAASYLWRRFGLCAPSAPGVVAPDPWRCCPQRNLCLSLLTPSSGSSQPGLPTTAPEKGTVGPACGSRAPSLESPLLSCFVFSQSGTKSIVSLLSESKLTILSNFENFEQF